MLGPHPRCGRLSFCAPVIEFIVVRAAAFSDIHGNVFALEAVLGQTEEASVDEYWIAGDLVAHGPHPAQTLRRIMGLPQARIVRGNTDRYVLTGDLPPMVPAAEQVRSADDAALLAQASASFAWTRGAIAAAGGLEWLAALPVEHRMQLPDGTLVLLVHASPGQDDGTGLQPDMTELDVHWDAAGADLIMVGHTHVPMERHVGEVRVINLGSVSIPATNEKRAMWTLVCADKVGVSIERRFAHYDLDATRAALDAAHHPSRDWLKSKF
jgi:predicted phosphodiesterase